MCRFPNNCKPFPIIANRFQQCSTPSFPPLPRFIEVRHTKRRVFQILSFPQQIAPGPHKESITEVWASKKLSKLSQTHSVSFFHSPRLRFGDIVVLQPCYSENHVLEVCCGSTIIETSFLVPETKEENKHRFDAFVTQIILYLAV